MAVPGTEPGGMQKPHWGTAKPSEPAKSPERVKADQSLGQAVRNMTGGWQPNINGVSKRAAGVAAPTTTPKI